MTSYRYVPDGKGGWQAVAMPGPAIGDHSVDPYESVYRPDKAADPGPLPTPERILQMQAVSDQIAQQDAGPATAADQLLADRQTIGNLAQGTVRLADPPRTAAERDARVIAARQLAARLGYTLATVPRLSHRATINLLTGGQENGPEIFTLVDTFGNCFPLGPLEAIESELIIRAREHAARERAEADAAERNAERARVQARALANSHAARLARLEAKLAAAGLPVD